MNDWAHPFLTFSLCAALSLAGGVAAGADRRVSLTIVDGMLASDVAANIVPIENLGSDRWNDKPVWTRGYVRNVFRDDIDPDYVFIVLQDGNFQAHAVCENCEAPTALVGSEIVISGTCRNTSVRGSRRYLSRLIYFSPTNAIHVVRTSYPGEDVPLLDTTRKLSADDILQLGISRTVGRVLAVLGQRQILLVTDRGAFVKAELAEDQLPSVGAVVELVGIPATDFYFLNLTGARWQPSAAEMPPVPPPTSLTVARLYTDYRGHPATPNVDYHGQHVSLTGILRHLPSGLGSASSDRPLLDDGGNLIPIICNACPSALEKLKVGSKVRLTGICVAEVSNWYPGAPFPLVSSLALSLASKDDVLVLQEPSWWTVGRLLTAVILLVAVLLGIIVWNVLLQRKAEQRGRTLAEAQLEQYGTRLRLGERTRLAVELHDSLSQTLAGIAMEVGTALQFSEKPSSDLVCHLERASRTIDACRQDLRNCLGDLRSHALEASDMESAIRLTLIRVADPAVLSIRFPVPRRYLNDNLVHNVLCIVRELVANAIHHGRAASVRVAGSLESGRLLFSVADDGCGFDTAKVPGVREGHFGLLGIRERVSRLNGELKLESQVGRGTHVRVSIPLSQDAGEGNA